MDKNNRAARRITAGYKAEIIFEDKTYQGVIENLSETGASITIISQDKSLKFTPGKKMNLTFEIQPGEKISVDCIIRWSTKLPPHGIINGIGLEIIDPHWEECNCFL